LNTDLQSHSPVSAHTLHHLCDQLESQLARALAGKPEAVRQTLICLLCGGHLLIEDLPGMGKTTLAKALAASLNSDFGRIQFTADLLPADITGVEIFDPGKQKFSFHPGPIFHHIILADEINRATPRAQSALLEAMAEAQVSIERETRALPHPFFVIATQNPREQSGTFPLPESQLDRFFMRISIGYPDREAERAILLGEAGREQIASFKSVATWQQIATITAAIHAMATPEPLADYLLSLLASSRSGKILTQGVSPRAGHDLLLAAKAHAWLTRQAMVTASDIQAVWLPLLSHRVVAHRVADHNNGVEAALLAVLEQEPVPG